MYNWVLTTILNRRKQEKGVIPAWVPPPPRCQQLATSADVARIRLRLAVVQVHQTARTAAPPPARRTE